MKRLLATLGVCLFLLGSATLPAAALTPTYTVTGAYKSSLYHKNILALTRTGDPAFDTVAAALSQLDYREGNSTADFAGENTAGSKNYTEYNRAMGKISGSYSYAWCAAFVSWCLDVAGARDGAGGKFTSCTLWVGELQRLGLYSTRASGYTPKMGDLIFFRSAGVSRASDHVGIVRYVKNGRVYTVEGNSSNKVSLRDYKLSDTYIVGYGKPKYGGTPLGRTALSMEDTVTGLYTVTNDFLNVRAAPTASAARLGVLYCGAMVRVDAIENGWGRITYNKKTAYISLDYADFTAPVFYTVTYTAEDAVGTPARSSYFSFEQSTASTVLPEREGYRFLSWQTAGGDSFAPGELLPSGDLTLVAVFEPIPTPEIPPAGSEDSEIPPLDAPALPEDAPEAALPDLPVPSPDTGNGAAIAAGAVSGILAAALFAWWLVKRRAAA